MDPKDINQLDPKLREAYERVMGTNLSTPTPQNVPSSAQPSAPNAQYQSQQTPPPAPQEAPPTSPVHLDTSQAGQASSSAAPVTPPVYQSYNAESGSSTPASTPAAVHHSSRFAISTPILVVLGVMFFAAYAALWVMVFGIKLF